MRAIFLSLSSFCVIYLYKHIVKVIWQFINGTVFIVILMIQVSEIVFQTHLQMLMLFYFSLQAEHLTSCYWGGSSNPTERHDPSLPYLEQYRIDVEQFKGLFNLLFPWANGAHSDPLAVRFFRLLDQNGDALINFREFISGLGKQGKIMSICP